MKNCKLIYTGKAVIYLKELGCTPKEGQPNGQAKGTCFIYVQHNEYRFGGSPFTFTESSLPFLEERDLLKIGPPIEAGDFIQVPVANGFFIRGVSRVTASKVFIKDNPTVHYNIEGVRRAPYKLIIYLREGGFLND